MGKGFLSGRLASVQRFRPGQPAADLDSSAPDPSPQTGNRGKAEQLAEVETRELHRQSLAEGWLELQRRRREVLRDLDEAKEAFDREQARNEELFQLLAEKRSRISEGPPDGPAPPPREALRRLTQDIHELSLELAIWRNRGEGSETAAAPAGLVGFSFVELCKVGFALTLPLLVVVLVAAAVVAITVAAVFGV